MGYHTELAAMMSMFIPNAWDRKLNHLLDTHPVRYWSGLEVRVGGHLVNIATGQDVNAVVPQFPTIYTKRRLRKIMDSIIEARRQEEFERLWEIL